MNTKNIDNFLSNLTPEQKKYLLSQLKESVFGSISQTVKNCPCCGENNFIKKGNYKGVQKYKCKKTSKIFSYRTSSVASGIWNLKKFEKLVNMMLDKKFPTITEIQQILGITRKTAFAWRTKILTAVYSVVELDNQIIEFDETCFRLSRKGRKGMLYSRKRGKKGVGDNSYNVKVFMSFSRTTGKLELYQSHIGRTASQDLENYLGVSHGMVIYSDRHPSFKKYYKKRRITHRTFISKQHIYKWNKEVHNQNLNYYCGYLQRFLDEDLKGVSTKYLQGYLNWFMFIENSIKKKKEEVVLKDVVVENKLALDIYKQKEKEFQYFLKTNGRNNYGIYNDRYYGKAA